MIFTIRCLGRWLAILALLTPIALRADEVRFKIDDGAPARMAFTEQDDVPAKPERTENSTYEQSDPANVLEQPETLASDIMLTANNDEPAPEPTEPFQTAMVVSDEPVSEEFVTSDPCVKCSCQQSWRPFAGVAATFLAPSHNTGGGSAILTGNYATGTTNLDRSATDRQMNISPRLWLGVQGEKWGAVVRYWN